MRTQSLDITTGSPASPLAGESTAWDDERGDVVDVDAGKGGPDCEQRAGDGSRGPLRESPPLRPGREPPARRRRGSRSTFPSKRYPPNAALGPSRIRKTGVIAVGHAQLGGSSWRHRSS
jgi:hypothetical protein